MLLAQLAQADGEMGTVTAVTAAHITPDGLRKLANRLVDRGLVQRTHGRIRLTPAGWRHPAAAAVQAERTRAEADVSQVDLAIEQQAAEAARMRLEVQQLQAEELQARRVTAHEQYLLDEIHKRRDRQYASDLTRGLSNWDVLVFIGRQTVRFDDLPARRKRSLITVANVWAREHGYSDRGPVAVALAARAAEQHIAEEQDRQEMLQRRREIAELDNPIERAMAWFQRVRPSTPAEAPATLPRPRSAPALPAPRQHRGAPAFLREPSTLAPPGLVIPAETQPGVPVAAEWHQLAERQGWMFWNGFNRPPVCMHGLAPGRCPRRCQLPPH